MRIAELDMEIHERQVLVEELRKFLPPDEEQDEGNERPPVPAKPRRKKAAAEPHANGNGKPKARDRIRAVLLDAGPLSPSSVAERLGVSGPAVGHIFRDDPWFEKVDPDNRKSPWQLTPEGRQGA